MSVSAYLCIELLELCIVYDAGKKQRVIIGISNLQMRMASGLTFTVTFHFNKAMKLRDEGRNWLHGDTCCPVGSSTCWKLVAETGWEQKFQTP